MADCCSDDSAARLHARQRGTLRLVFAINAVMFVVMMGAALYADSTALLADGLDNLGDALTYGLSFVVAASGATAKARVALFKGVLIGAAALLVAAALVYRLVASSVPVFELMGVFSVLALAANSVCLFLLWRHRHEDINMQSVWECSRNDIAANIAVFVAAAGVGVTGSAWPDMVVAAALLVVLLRSAVRVISAAWRQLRVAA